MTIHVLDDCYLSITLLITIGYQLFFFLVAFSLRFDKLTDFAGGTNFVLLSTVSLCLNRNYHVRNLVVSFMNMIWALRLSIFLFFRILKTGKDDRFDDKRDKFFPFLGFWAFQMLWVWIVSLPVTMLNSPSVNQYQQPLFGNTQDIAGVVLYLIGLLIESDSDVTKYRFRSKVTNRSAICNNGLFSWSRHPNYFGEILVQFSIYIVAVCPATSGYVKDGAYRALYTTILGPIFLTLLLMFVSGLNLSERPAAKRRYLNHENWDEYACYLRRTSILIPFPPTLYARLPTILKRTVLLEFPIYVFDPSKHSE